MENNSIDNLYFTSQKQINIWLGILLFCAPIFILTYFAPLYYDDITRVANYEAIGHFSFRDMLKTAKHMYDRHGRIGTAFSHVMICFPAVYALLLGIVIPMLFIGAPFLLIHKRIPYYLNDIPYIILYFGICCSLMLLFPNWFFIMTEWTNKTMGLTYGVNTALYFTFIALLWLLLVENLDIINIKNYLFILIIFCIGLFTPIHNEFVTIYANGLILSILFYTFLFHRKSLDNLKKSYSLCVFYIGNVIGTIIILTSKGFLSNIFNKGQMTRGGWANIAVLLLTEVFPLAIILLLILLVVFTIAMNLNKPKHKDLLKESLSISSFLLGSFGVFIFLCLVTKIPYFRTMLIAVGLIPLVYLLLYWLTQLVKKIMPYKGFKVILSIVFLIPICYMYYVTAYNLQSIYSINYYYQEQIKNLKEEEPLILTRYKISFKRHYNIFSKDLRTSEMGHAFTGSNKEAVDYGIRVMFHVPQAWASDTGPTMLFIKFNSKAGFVPRVVEDIATPPVDIPRISWIDIIKNRVR